MKPIQSPTKTKSILYSFTGRLGLLISASFLLISIVSATIIYQQSRLVIITGISERLKDVGRISMGFMNTPETKKKLEKLQYYYFANTTFGSDLEFALLGPDLQANSADDRPYNSIPNKEIMGSDQFLDLVTVLRKIRSSSREILFPSSSDLKPIHILRTFEADSTPQIEGISIVSKVPVKNDNDVLKLNLEDYSSFYDPDYVVATIVDAEYHPVYDDGFGNRYPGNPIGNTYLTQNPRINQAFLLKKPLADTKFKTNANGQNYISAYIPIILDYQSSVSLLLQIDFNVSNQTNALEEMLQTCISAVLLSLLISMITTYFISVWINRPIKILAEGAEKVTHGNYATRINLKSKDEMGKLADSFNHMISEIDSYSQYLKSLNKAYERFVPKQFLMQLNKSDITEINLGDQVEKVMSVLFSDIRSFTTLSENMSPHENFKFLNTYLENVAPKIQESNGFIERFIGDAIVALFPDDQVDLYHTSINIQKTVQNLNKTRGKNNLEPISIGISLHRGALVLGTIGEKDRMNSTILSDTIQVSEQLESLTKKFEIKIIASETLIDNLAKNNRQELSEGTRIIGVLPIKNNQSIKLYEIFSADAEAQIELKRKSKHKLEEAIHMILSNKSNISKSLKIFQEILKQNPKDTVTRIYQQRCLKLS